jgi:anthranilate phosphoribosyltransferase
VRTVFNLLGPLTNPAAPRFLLIGAYDAEAAALMADTLAGMDITRAWVVHGAAGWDEVTPIGPFTAFDVVPGKVLKLEVDPLQFGLEVCSAADLAGGNAAANAAALHAVFERRDHGPHRCALALQCGLALYIGGAVTTIAAGIDAARATLESGRAERWLHELKRFALAAGEPPRS